MKILISVLLLCFSFSANASTIISSIKEIDYGKAQNDLPLVLFNQDGRIGFIPDGEEKNLRTLEYAWFLNHEVQVELDPNHLILQAKLLPSKVSPAARMPLESTAPEKSFFNEPSDYQPTIVPNLDEATKIFNRLNPYYNRRSECYNRAEVWTYEELKNHGIYSMKVFMFFTRKYIREYGYGWWFHVSPYLLVNENGTVTERVIDYTFMNEPVMMKPWSDHFVRPKEECPVVQKYTDYEEHQQDHYCYFMKVPMYYWQPWHLERLEQTGEVKTEFLPSEINTAYSQAFRRGLGCTWGCSPE